MSATLVLVRGEEDLFVEMTLNEKSGKWSYIAYDENGLDMILTEKEFHAAIELARAGVDLTGR